MKGVATELSRKQHQAGDDMRRLLKCKYILRRVYSQNDLQVSTEYCEKKLMMEFVGTTPRYTVEI